MKFYSRIIFYTFIIIAGIYSIATKIYAEFTNKNMATFIDNSKSSAYRIGHFIGHFIIIGLGSLLIIAGITGIVYTFKKFKYKVGDNN